ncbi:MAG: hypothetical protein ACUVWX_14540, partial [Kiritimatiellia bacterium]
RIAGEEEIVATFVHITQAARHTGRLTIRHSPLLSVRTVETAGAVRTDVVDESTTAKLLALAGESPLGIRPYEAYDFVTVPFQVKMRVKESEVEATAEVRSILRLTERERTLEAWIEFDIARRPIYAVRIAVPAEMEVDSVTATSDYEWTSNTRDNEQVLSVYFASGRLGRVPVVIQGHLGRAAVMRELALPRVRVLDVKRQKGEIAVLADPGFNVDAAGLESIEKVLVERVLRWLRSNQHAFVRLALHYENPEYQGVLALSPREPDVSSVTLMNVRLTDRSIDETVLLDFTIREAGLREIEFWLPAHMAEARISVPLLRQKMLSPATNGMVRVLLLLQDAVAEQLKVLVEHDRALSSAEQTVRLPEVRTGRALQRYVTIENASRDEIAVTQTEGLEPLARQQKEWVVPAALLQGGNVLGYAATPGAAKPALKFRITERKAVETAGASIGLAETLLIMDAAGTYRGRQTYHINNRTEQFLEILLPRGAELWTAQVAGEFVKPVVPDAKRPRRVCIPIVKTAVGDLDYNVVLTYGGQTYLPDWFGRAELPIVTAVNIAVELSQLEVRLPTTHEWLHFTGTMERVVAAEVFQAGVLEYQSKVASSLLYAIRFGDVFSKKRAAANLRKWRENIADAHSGLQTIAYGGETVSTEISKMKQVLDESEAELQKTSAPEEGQMEDNRSRLDRVFQIQVVNPTANAVLRGEPNWKQAEVASSAPAGTTAMFNKAWLDEKGLAPPPPKPTRLEGERAKEEQREGKKQEEAEQTRDKRRAQIDAPTSAALVMQDIFAHRKDDKPAKKVSGPSRSQAHKAEQYAEKLSKQQAVGEIPQQVPYARGVSPAAETPPEVQTAVVVPPAGSDADALKEGRLRLTGLASLALELPAEDPERWEYYRFRTPRGDVRVTGWTISRQKIALLKRIAAGLGLVLVIGLLRAFVRHRSPNAERRRSTAVTLIIVGVVCVLVGVLPIAAALAVIVGLIFLFHSRRTIPHNASSVK